MGSALDETSKQPVVKLSELAALKLKILLQDEPDADRLCYRVVPATTGCGSTAFQVTLTEKKDGDHLLYVRDIPFAYRDPDRPFLNGLAIELNRKSGHLELFNSSYQPEVSDCCTNP